METEFNVRSSLEDFDKAAKFRKEYLQRLHCQPTYVAMRAAHDRANQVAPPPSAATTQQQQKFSANTAAKEAMQALKDSLNNIRSRNNSFFKESVPVTQNEACVRGLISSDYVDEKVGKDANSASPTTSVTVNLRPHNTESYVSARKSLLKGTEIPNLKRTDEVFVGKVVVNVDESEGKEAVQAKIGKIKSVYTLLFDEMAKDLDAEIKPCFSVDESSGQTRFTITMVKELPKKADFFNLAIQGISKSVLRREGGHFNADTAATDMLRLATLRVEIPHDLVNWINNEENRSVSSLLEGVRIAFEAIARDNAKELLYQDMAKGLLEDFDTQSVIGSILSTVALMFGREVNFNAHTAPFDLLFANAVHEIAPLVRASLKQEFEESWKADDDDYVAKFNKQVLGTTFPEEAVGTALSSLLPIAGLTPLHMKSALLGPIGEALAPATQADESALPLIQIALDASNLVGDLVTAEFITPSASLVVDTKGITGKFLQKMIPNSIQEFLDYYKMVLAAGSEDWDHESEETRQKVIEAVESKSDQLDITNGDYERTLIDGWFKDIKEKLCIDPLDESGEFIVRRWFRTHHFVLTQVITSLKEAASKKNPLYFGDLPEELTQFKKKKSESDEEQEEENDDDADIPTRPSNNNNNNEEVVEVSGGSSGRPLLQQRPTSAPPSENGDEQQQQPSIPRRQQQAEPGALIAPSSRHSPSARRHAAIKASKNRLFERLGSSFVIPTDEESLRDIFNSFDQNNDGKISKQEFTEEYREFESAFGVPLSDRDIQAKFRRADRNNDGNLSFKEFCYFMVSRAAQ